ncbi:hypothetical protein ABK040_009512 [Willaertia magna]
MNGSNNSSDRKRTINNNTTFPINIPSQDIIDIDSDDFLDGYVKEYEQKQQQQQNFSPTKPNIITSKFFPQPTCSPEISNNTNNNTINNNNTKQSPVIPKNTSSSSLDSIKSTIITSPIKKQTILLGDKQKESPHDKEFNLGINKTNSPPKQQNNSLPNNSSGKVAFSYGVSKITSSNGPTSFTSKPISTTASHSSSSSYLPSSSSSKNLHNESNNKKENKKSVNNENKRKENDTITICTLSDDEVETPIKKQKNEIFPSDTNHDINNTIEILDTPIENNSKQNAIYFEDDDDKKQSKNDNEKDFIKMTTKISELSEDSGDEISIGDILEEDDLFSPLETTTKTSSPIINNTTIDQQQSNTFITDKKLEGFINNQNNIQKQYIESNEKLFNEMLQYIHTDWALKSENKEKLKKYLEIANLSAMTISQKAKLFYIHLCYYILFEKEKRNEYIYKLFNCVNKKEEINEKDMIGFNPKVILNHYNKNDDNLILTIDAIFNEFKLKKPNYVLLRRNYTLHYLIRTLELKVERLAKEDLSYKYSDEYGNKMKQIEYMKFEVEKKYAYLKSKIMKSTKR